MSVWEDTYQAPEHGNPLQPVREPAPGAGSPDGTGAGLDVGFFAQIGVHLGSLVDQLKRTNDRADHLFEAVPYDAPILGQQMTNATGLAVVACGGPALGRQWQVRQVAVSGPEKGSVAFYACPAAPALGQGLGLKDSTKSRWPAPAFYGTHQFVLNPPEQVFVVVTTATATTQVVVSGTAEDYELGAYHSVETL